MILNKAERVSIDLSVTEALELIQELSKLVVKANNNGNSWSRMNAYAEHPENKENHVLTSLVLRVENE